MIKICIILPKGLPVPAVKGGAIESLMTDIINQNEKLNRADITIASVYDKAAINESKKYKNTKFIYINLKNIKYIFKAIKVRLLNFFGSHQNTYNEMILDKIKKQKFDYIVVEDGAFHSFKTYLKYFNKEQMILHFHHVGGSDKYTDQTYEKFFGVSQFVVDRFKKTSNISKCFTVKNGIDINKFNKKLSSNEKIKIKNKFGFAKDDFVVVYCGRLIEQKGVLELVKAVKSIKNDGIKLMIVGSINFGKKQKSEYLSILNEEIKSSNGKVVLTGYIPNNEMFKYYKSADICVVPSLWNDAAPLVVIEAMSCGVPLIVSKTGGVPEYASVDTIIIPYSRDFVAKIAAAITSVSFDMELLKKMSTSGIKEASKYTTENFYNDFINKIEE